MLEGEGDAFLFHLKHEMLTANHVNVILKPKIKNC
jgi:hypothetical protein